MIHATELSMCDFRARFPDRSDLDKKITLDGVMQSVDHKALLNDIPPAVSSCLIYNQSDLKAHFANPPIYSIPTNFQMYRELKSLQAVFKTLPGCKDECIFSHMFISPEDVEHVFGNKFIQRKHKVQKLVCHSLLERS